MKIKPEHYESIRDRIKSKTDSFSPEFLKNYKEALKADSRVKDLDKRYRWDILWASVPSSWLCDNLYKYMNDDHLDTALRAIVKELKL